MSILQELVALHEAATMKLYIEHPYGHGFDTTAITRGEFLPTEDGDEVAFQKVAPGGKTIMAKNRNGETIEVTVASVGGKVLPSNEKPEAGKNGFMMAEGKSGPANDVKMTIGMPLESAGLKPHFKDDGSMITVSFKGDDVASKLKTAMKEIKPLLKRLDSKIEVQVDGDTFTVIYSHR
jgi:hypothetical protein